MEKEYRYLVVADKRHDSELVSRLIGSRIESGYKPLFDGRIYRAEKGAIESLKSDLQALSAIDYEAVLLCSFDLTAEQLAAALVHCHEQPWISIWPVAEVGHQGRLCFDVGVSRSFRSVKD